MEVTVRFRAPLIEKHLKRIGDLMEDMGDVLKDIATSNETIAQIAQGIERAVDLLANNTDPRVQQAHDLLTEQHNALIQARDRLQSIGTEPPPEPTP